MVVLYNKPQSKQSGMTCVRVTGFCRRLSALNVSWSREVGPNGARVLIVSNHGKTACLKVARARACSGRCHCGRGTKESHRHYSRTDMHRDAGPQHPHCKRTRREKEVRTDGRTDGRTGRTNLQGPFVHHLGLGQLTRSLPGSVDEWGRRKCLYFALSCFVHLLCRCMWVSPTRTAFWEVVAILLSERALSKQKQREMGLSLLKGYPCFVAFKGKPKDSGSKDASPMVGDVFSMVAAAGACTASPPINFSKVMAPTSLCFQTAKNGPLEASKHWLEAISPP